METTQLGIVGHTVAKINSSGDRIEFEMESGDIYDMFHQQDCCEIVYIEEIIGDINDLIGSPLTMAEEVVERYSGNSSRTWTFYKFATVKGYVTIRWFGQSNGYYSETVTFCKK